VLLTANYSCTASNNLTAESCWTLVFPATVAGTSVLNSRRDGTGAQRFV